jgi:hypothetical protein
VGGVKKESFYKYNDIKPDITKKKRSFVGGGWMDLAFASLRKGINAERVENDIVELVLFDGP